MELCVQVSSTFIANPIADYLFTLIGKIGYEPTIKFSPYNQVLQSLLQPDVISEANTISVELVLFRYSDWLKLDRVVDKSELATEIRNLTAELLEAVKSYKAAHNSMLILCQLPDKPLEEKGFSLDEFSSSLDQFYKQSGLAIQDVALITGTQVKAFCDGKSIYDETGDAIGALPFGDYLFACLGLNVVRLINSKLQKPNKVIVVDCDQVLWKGVCAEVGPKRVDLDEASLFLQKFLVGQCNKGKLICLASKNIEKDVLAVFRERSDMVLKESHLTSMKVNWESKSENINMLAEELSLGLDSFIFIDDNPVEIADVELNCPGVLTITFPEEQVPHFLNNFWAFDVFRVTKEDAKRQTYYKQSVQRNQLLKKSAGLEGFIKQLDLKVEIGKALDLHIDRISQLLMRSNQFNFTTRRHDVTALQSMLAKGFECLSVFVSDRFGDYGLVGVVIYKIEQDKGVLEVDSLLLSCRVLGRGVEFELVRYLAQIARSQSIGSISFTFIRTERNIVAEKFLKIIVDQSDATILDDHYVFESEKLEQVVLEKGQSSADHGDASPVAKPSQKKEVSNNAEYFFDIANRLSVPDNLIGFCLGESKRVFDKEVVLPQTPLEQSLVNVWEKQLNVHPVGVDDNFFLLGGDSIAAVKVISDFWQETGVLLELTQFLKFPTVRLLLSTREEGVLKTQLTKRAGGLSRAPLSFSQSRLWYLHQLNAVKSVYNMSIVWEIGGCLDVEALQQSVNSLLERHVSFRTKFSIDSEGVPFQEVLPSSSVLVLVEVNEVDCEEIELKSYIKALANKPFDLKKPPLIRLNYVKTKAQDYLVLVIHHIIHDGWSFEIFCHELAAFYNAYIEDKELPSALLRQEPLDMLDFAIWQRQTLTTKALQDEVGYWCDFLSGYEGAALSRDLNLTCSKNSGARVPFVIPKKLVSQLKTKFLNHTTLFNVLFSVFSLSLYYYSDFKEKFLIGTATSGRSVLGTNSIIGFFVNILLLRCDLSENISVENFLTKNYLMIQEVFKHEALPFEKLVEAINPQRLNNENPLAQVMFVFEQFSISCPELNGLKVQRAFNEGRVLMLADFDTSKFDLTLFLQETEGELAGLFEYSTSRFSGGFIESLLNTFLKLCEEFCENSSKAIFELDYLTAKQRSELMQYSAGPSVSNLPSLYELLEETFTQFSDETCVFDSGGEQLSYREVYSLAKCLANKLNGFDSGFVGCYLSRTYLAPVAMLAVWLAHKVYVPLDASLPSVRLNYILNDCNPAVLLVDDLSASRLSELVEDPKLYTIITVSSLLEFDQQAANEPLRDKDDAELAYAIYTSGSTGKPKGVMLYGRTLVNLARWQGAGISGRKKVAQFASFGFDVSLQEMTFSIFNGCELHVLSQSLKDNTLLLLSYLNEKRINILFLPTAYLSAFCEMANESAILLDSVEQVIVAGEALKINEEIQAFFLRHPSLQLCNQYGPSETHVVTEKVLQALQAKNWPPLPTIGKPITNTSVFVLNNKKQLVPFGVSGELYITGQGVAAGYLHADEKSKTKFAGLTLGDQYYKNAYCTGDLVRWGGGAELHYVGRKDTQVQLRGYRVEVEEIEALILQFPKVKQAVVLLSSDQQYLVAYLSLYIRKIDFSTSGLRAYLADRLPAYMVPAVIVALDEMPVTLNGKVDKKRLVQSADIPIDYLFDKPTDEVEQRLVEIFSSLLGRPVDKISTSLSFFDLGGHSLLAIKLIVAVYKAFHVKLPLKVLYAQGSIKAIAKRIAENSSDSVGKVTVEDDCLVVMNKTSPEKPRVFAFPPAIGKPFCYQSLAEGLEGSRVFYAYEDPRFAFVGNKKFSFDELVELYFKHLLNKIDRKQSINLLGYSLGGSLAVKLCQRLEQAGVVVNAVVLIDSYLSYVPEFKVCSVNVESLLAEASAAEKKQLLRVFEENKQLNYSNVTYAIKARINAFCAIPPGFHHTESAIKAHFAAITAGAVEINLLDANHVTILDMQNSAYIAQALYPLMGEE